MSTDDVATANALAVVLLLLRKINAALFPPPPWEDPKLSEEERQRIWDSYQW